MRLLSLILLPAVAYQVLAIVAGVLHWQRQRVASRRKRPPLKSGVSVLKPLRGLDPNTAEAFASQMAQDFPMFEILFGVRDPEDPAASEVRRLQDENPSASMRLIVSTTESPNGKVGVLADLARYARYPVWVVNDSDIRVTPDYLAVVTAPLSDPSVGVVTCLYHALAHTGPAAWEAFGIATDFMPSTVTAQFIGVREFGLGSTLAFRAADLKAAGNFESFANYLADDYQLAKRITGLGKRAVLSTYVVETALAADSWTGIWLHQLRWARTIRFSKGKGYAGLPITHAGIWTLLGFALGLPWTACLLLVLRIASGFITGWFILRSPVVLRYFFAAPIWDLYAFCVWLASYAGTGVRWRDKVLKIDSLGRIESRNEG